MSLFASPPDIIRWCARTQGHGDCSVAALAHACGVTYEVALASSVVITPNVLVAGLTNAEFKRVARILGYTVVMRRKFDLDDDTGVLDVEQLHVHDSGHHVYLWEGRIIEPKYDRQQLWLSAKDYLSHYKYTAHHLLTLTKED